MERYDLVVIGSGPAGEKGAAQAAYFGKRVALVEHAAAVGGRLHQYRHGAEQDAARVGAVFFRAAAARDLRH